ENTLQQCLIVSAGKVGTADTVFEQHITDDELFTFAIEKADTGGRMSGRKKHLQLSAPKLYNIPLIKESHGLRHRVNRGAIHLTDLCGVVQHDEFTLVDFREESEFCTHKRDSKDMIDMAVGIDQAYRTQLL